MEVELLVQGLEQRNVELYFVLIVLIGMQVNLKGDWPKKIKALIPFPNRGYVGKPPHSLTPKQIYFLCDSMEEQVDVGVANPIWLGASMDIKFYVNILFFV